MLERLVGVGASIVSVVLGGVGLIQDWPWWAVALFGVMITGGIVVAVHPKFRKQQAPETSVLDKLIASRDNAGVVMENSVGPVSDVRTRADYGVIVKDSDSSVSGVRHRPRKNRRG